MLVPFRHGHDGYGQQYPQGMPYGGHGMYPQAQVSSHPQHSYSNNFIKILTVFFGQVVLNFKLT